MAVDIASVIRNSVDGFIAEGTDIKGTYITITGLGDDTKENVKKSIKTSGCLVFDDATKKSWRWYGDVETGNWVDVTTKTVVETEVKKVVKTIVVDGGLVTGG